jgi:hypothetical protein
VILDGNPVCDLCGEPVTVDVMGTIHVGDTDPDSTMFDHEAVLRSCSMCGATSHTERESDDDGEWDENCRYVSYIDGDGNNLRRT